LPVSILVFPAPNRDIRAMRVLCRVNPPSGATRKQISVSRLGTVVGDWDHCYWGQ
jgi:hypothetical protein